MRDQDRDDSWNVVGRLGFTEFFVEERGEAAGVAALEQLTAENSPAPIPSCVRTWGWCSVAIESPRCWRKSAT